MTLKNFSVFELILMALIAAAGIAIKPLIVGITHLLTGPLFIPGGALAGGLYMLFIVLGGGLIQKRGAPTIICIVQTFLVLVTGVYGSHGAASIFSYILPGLLVDIVWILTKSYGDSLMSCFIGGIVANTCGTFVVNIIFFRLPVIPLLLSLCLAVFSGALGGVICWQIIKALTKSKLLVRLGLGRQKTHVLNLDEIEAQQALENEDNNQPDKKEQTKQTAQTEESSKGEAT